MLASGNSLRAYHPRLKNCRKADVRVQRARGQIAATSSSQIEVTFLPWSLFAHCSQFGSEALGSVEVKALSNAEKAISPSAILTLLKQDAGVDLLLHEAGPTLFGEFVAGGFVDELFLTVAPQIAGRVAEHPRPGLVANIEFSPATAPGGSLSAQRVQQITCSCGIK